MAEFDLSTSKKIIQVKGLINRPVHSRPLTHELHVQVKSQPLTHILETTYGTPAPPGTPKLWYDAADMDGFYNSGLVHGNTITSWINKGTQASATLTANGTAVTYSTADGIKSMKKPDNTTGGMFNTALGTVATGDFTYAIIFRLDTAVHFRNLGGFGSSGGSPHVLGLTGTGFASHVLQANMATGSAPSTTPGQFAANRWEYIICQRREAPDSQVMKLSGNATVSNTNAVTSRLFDRVCLPGEGAFTPNGNPAACHIAQFAAWEGYDPSAPTLVQIENWAKTVTGKTLPFQGT